ncbi:MAG: TldD/PmbA family protein [Pseudomonadales bacterium]
MSALAGLEARFYAAGEQLFAALTGNEALTLNLSAEDSVFVRFNGARVRQNTAVEQQHALLGLQKDGRTASIAVPFAGAEDELPGRLREALDLLRRECASLPEDPYQVPYVNNGASRQALSGTLADERQIATMICESAQGTDFAGLYCGGPLVQANMNSKGQRHWFATEQFFVDYSLYTHTDKAVKAIYAGREWNPQAFDASLHDAKQQLAILERPVKEIPRGRYRTYLAPHAAAELVSMFSWDAISQGSLLRGQSPLQKLSTGEAALSEKFTLRENFTLGLNPRFNSLGETAPELLPLIEGGRSANLLTSSRTALEYGLTSNFAEPSETLRSPEVLTGSLPRKRILAELDTGLYVGALHYLNWSDQMSARLTGMTRYACFWVQGGEIVAPIRDLRFDESLYDGLGRNLIDLTDFSEVISDTGTYGARSLGGSRVPGMLIDDFTFTL